jgi:hypothetical protein
MTPLDENSMRDAEPKNERSGRHESIGKFLSQCLCRNINHFAKATRALISELNAEPNIFCGSLVRATVFLVLRMFTQPRFSY